MGYYSQEQDFEIWKFLEAFIFIEFSPFSILSELVFVSNTSLKMSSLNPIICQIIRIQKDLAFSDQKNLSVKTAKIKQNSHLYGKIFLL